MIPINTSHTDFDGQGNQVHTFYDDYFQYHHPDTGADIFFSINVKEIYNQWGGSHSTPPDLSLLLSSVDIVFKEMLDSDGEVVVLAAEEVSELEKEIEKKIVIS